MNDICLGTFVETWQHSAWHLPAQQREGWWLFWLNGRPSNAWRIVTKPDMKSGQKSIKLKGAWQLFQHSYKDIPSNREVIGQGSTWSSVTFPFSLYLLDLAASSAEVWCYSRDVTSTHVKYMEKKLILVGKKMGWYLCPAANTAAALCNLISQHAFCSWTNTPVPPLLLDGDEAGKCWRKHNGRLEGEMPLVSFWWPLPLVPPGAQVTLIHLLLGCLLLWVCKC